MTDKITVNTPDGDVSIGDECELENGKRYKLVGIDGYMGKYRYTINLNGDESYAFNIRPVQKPKPLEGMEQYEKFVELGLKGWSFRVVMDTREEPLISVIFHDINMKSDLSTLEIRAPRSTEWIRAVDVTEETGNV